MVQWLQFLKRNKPSVGSFSIMRGGGLLRVLGVHPRFGRTGSRLVAEPGKVSQTVDGGLDAAGAFAEGNRGHDY